MKVLKAGCILISAEKQEIGLVYRPKRNDYSFPKGHLEEAETLQECAIRETEEETGRKCHLVSDKELDILYYTDSLNDEVEAYYYLAIDDGVVDRMINDNDKEILVWTKIDDVISLLSHEDIRQMWIKTLDFIKNNYN